MLQLVWLSMCVYICMCVYIYIYIYIYIYRCSLLSVSLLYYDSNVLSFEVLVIDGIISTRWAATSDVCFVHAPIHHVCVIRSCPMQ